MMKISHKTILRKIEGSKDRRGYIQILTEHQMVPSDYFIASIYKDFVSREEFINRTGIFVTPEHFEYIYDMEFKKADASIDEFVNHYEETHSDRIVEIPLNGTFKYKIMDEDLSCIGVYEDTRYPNIWEIVNSLATSYTTEHQAKRKFAEKYKAALEDKLKMLNEMLLRYAKSSDAQS